jgi:hypothetical protein
MVAQNGNIVTVTDLIDLGNMLQEDGKVKPDFYCELYRTDKSVCRALGVATISTGGTQTRVSSLRL